MVGLEHQSTSAFVHLEVCHPQHHVRGGNNVLLITAGNIRSVLLLEERMQHVFFMSVPFLRPSWNP